MTEAAANPQPTAQAQLLKPSANLIVGQPGGGKSFAITTYIEAGVDTFVLLTEPNGIESIMKSMHMRKLPMDKLHVRTLAPMAPGFEALLDQANKVNTLSFEGIQKLQGGMSKELTRQYTELLMILRDFVDDNGTHWGDVTSWGDDRALVIDSLTGINTIIMDQTIGYKPVANQSEWQLAMNMQRKLMLFLSATCRCFFTVTAHSASEADEVVGSKGTTIDALGSKNAKPITAMFGTVVTAKREGTQFYWSTIEHNTVTKPGVLGFGDKILPSFVPIVLAHRANTELARKAVRPLSAT